MELAATPQWTRETTWRQGHVLPFVAIKALGLHHSESTENTCVVVISHDCDLANDNLASEPDVEIIIGRVVPDLNGSFALGKAPRTHHLDVIKDGVSLIVELIATCKRSIPKSVLAAYRPDESIALAQGGLKVLRNWLAIRYNRGAFPDTFVNLINAGKFSAKLSKLLEHHGKIISTVFSM